MRSSRQRKWCQFIFLFINQPNPIGDGGDQYTGLDRFGRVVDQYWTLAGSASDRFQYTYDQDSNRLTRTNVVNNNFNEQYGYDNLNQLTSFSRGAHAQSWGLDALGNWSTFVNDGNTQTRGHNVQNQITSISGLTTPTYDNNGNTTLDQNNKALLFDAWNRLVSYASTPSVSYGYDALNRRITSASAGTTTDLFYSMSWQVLEERIAGVTQAQYVWSPVYVDAMVERDRGLERVYVQQDANWNVSADVAKVGGIWDVQERYVYDPYGAWTRLKKDWTAQTQDLFQWIYLHQDGRYDGSSGLYYFRNRDYSPTLGRWMEEDPIEYAAGDPDLYRYVRNNSLNATDPNGLYEWSTNLDTMSFARGFMDNPPLPPLASAGCWSIYGRCVITITVTVDPTDTRYCRTLLGQVLPQVIKFDPTFRFGMDLCPWIGCKCRITNQSGYHYPISGSGPVTITPLILILIGQAGFWGNQVLGCRVIVTIRGGCTREKWCQFILRRSFLAGRAYVRPSKCRADLRFAPSTRHFRTACH